MSIIFEFLLFEVMLKINEFYWRLYKESPEGKRTIKKFEKASKSDFTIDESVSLFNEFDPDWFLNSNIDDATYLFEIVEECFCGLDWSKSARDVIENWIESEFYDNNDKKYKEAINFLVPISFYLYRQSLESFIPYMFVLRYHYLRHIFEDYDVEIMGIPGRNSFKDRFFYYFDICNSLNRFREFNGLTQSEFCA